jgi:predicted amino acid dehydrogenase
VLGFAVGSLAIGGLFIKWTTGKNPVDVNAHALGIENTFRFLGAPAALAAFFLDCVKGFVVLAVTQGNPWAGLGVVAGHLFPLPQLRLIDQPRGRGNGVLLGVLAGFSSFTEVNYWVLAVPVLLYAALLALTGYAAVATVGGLMLFTVLSFFVEVPESFEVVVFLLLLVTLWQNKSGFTRIADGTEAKLGAPPHVRGANPDAVLAAFMLHPFTVEDLWQPRSLGWLGTLSRRGRLPEPILRRFMMFLRPQVHGEITGIRLEDGRELRVLLISGTFLPDQIRAHPDLATRLAIQGARLAKEFGAEAFGLGAFLSTVGRKGLDVQAAVPGITITNGGAYTAGTVREAVPGLLERYRLEGGALESATAAVIGANGVVGFGVARMIAPLVNNIILIGKDADRLERSVETLRRKFSATKIVASTDVASIGAADLVFTATSDPDPVVLPEHVKPGAWLYDLGRPADVAPSVREIPGVHIIPGGVVKPPGEMRSSINIHFGDGMVPACMAETMIMTATKAFDRASLGPATKTADIGFYLREGKRLGFEVVTRDERVAELEEAV